jgi:HlyD family secretion protein
MKPGQRVRSTLFLGKREAALAVPRQAIFEREGESVVYIDRQGRFEPQPVEVGPAALGRVVVESGLDEGDRVALSDPTRPTQDSIDGGGGDATSAGPVAGAAF